MNTEEKIVTKPVSHIGILKQKYSTISATSRLAEEIIEATVNQYAGPLDKIIKFIEKKLDDVRDGNKNKITDEELHRLVLRIPVLQYHMIDMIDRAAIEVDVAKAAKNIIYNNALINSSGTQQYRIAHAEAITSDEAELIDMAKHVYHRLKQRSEVADSMFDAIRKLMTSYDVEKQTFRKDTK